MSNNPFGFMVDQFDHDIAPKLPSEFAPWYILALVAQDCAAKKEQVKHARLRALGSWLVSLGLRIKHVTHPYVARRHLLVRTVSLHHPRVRHRR
jgi:hypothetical protein